MRKVRKTEYLTPANQRVSVSTAQERYRSLGLVQLSVWVPLEDAQSFKDAAGELRVAHLKRKGYYG